MQPNPTRRELLLAGGTAALCTGADARAEDPPAKVYRIGVISASIDGKPQKTNGHTWHFAQYFHPTVNLDAIKKYLDPGSAQLFRTHLRNGTVEILPECGHLPQMEQRALVLARLRRFLPSADDRQSQRELAPPVRPDEA